MSVHAHGQASDKDICETRMHEGKGADGRMYNGRMYNRRRETVSKATQRRPGSVRRDHGRMLSDGKNRLQGLTQGWRAHRIVVPMGGGRQRHANCMNNGVF